MDLMDFDQAGLYFDEPVADTVQNLIAQAGDTYGDPGAEDLLLRAYFLAPEALIVLVALYRYYFYQHRLADALIVADRALRIVGARLGEEIISSLILSGLLKLNSETDSLR